MTSTSGATECIDYGKSALGSGATKVVDVVTRTITGPGTSLELGILAQD